LERLVSGVAYHPEPPVELLDTALDARYASRSAETNALGLRVRLTARQREVLDLMMRGLSNTEIAERLVLAVPTVKSHVRAVLRASGAVNRSDALARFTRDTPPNTQIRAQRIHRR
jgi:DNA-binding NarL/FixJ family response regulator